jgi:hypothetical protein
MIGSEYRRIPPQDFRNSGVPFKFLIQELPHFIPVPTMRMDKPGI